MCSRCTADDRAYWAPHREQSRRAGPALFGSIRLVKSEVGWKAPCLCGKAYRQRGNMCTARITCDF